MKKELCGKLMIRFVELRAKTYSYLQNLQLTMAIDDKIRNEKLQYDINKETA